MEFYNEQYRIKLKDNKMVPVSDLISYRFQEEDQLKAMKVVGRRIELLIWKNIEYKIYSGIDSSIRDILLDNLNRRGNQ